MNGHPFTFAGHQLIALPSGALWWPGASLLAVSDLHLGKAARRARSGAALLPPYETADCLFRLTSDLAATGAARVLCLGDSFDDDLSAEALSVEDRRTLAALQQGRDWLWIEGNHDARARNPGGFSLTQMAHAGISFRHIADPMAETPEISGHYHPKASLVLRGMGLSRPCFLLNDKRLILPAYGTYTGGLNWTSPVLRNLMQEEAIAILTGPRPIALSLPRRRAAAL